MKNRIMASLLIIAMLLVMLPVTVAAEEITFPDWYNPEATEYHITSEADLWDFAETSRMLVDNSEEPFSGKTVYLDTDIDLNWAEWYPLNFYGTFEGGNHTIKNLTYVTTGTQMGFFNSLNGTAKNLTIDGVKATLVEGGKLGGFTRLLNGYAENVHIKNITVEAPGKIDWFIGGFAGFAYGYAKNCSVENFTVNASDATGEPCIGGFIGSIRNSYTYTNCDVKGFKAVVNATSETGIGGFTPHTQTGWNHSKFIDCDVTGIDFTISGIADVAGFITWPGSHTTATNCTTEGNIDVSGVTTGDYVGGFYGNCGWNADLGQKGHSLTDCSADVDITTKFVDAGGFIGSATVSGNGSKYLECYNCSANGDITCVEDGTATVGGFAGDADRGVYNSCSASGTITNNGSGNAGQFIGAFYDVTPKYDYRYPAGTRDYLVDESTVEDCYYTGESTNLEFIGNTAEGADLTIESAPVAKEDLVYTGEDQELVTAGIYGGTLYYVIGTDNATVPTEEVWSEVIPKAQDAKTYYVWYKVESNENSNSVAPACIEVSIAKAQAKIEVDADDINVVYGEGVTLPEATTNFGVVTCDKTSTDFVNAAVGSYTVTYTVAGTDNYVGDSVSITVNVGKASQGAAEAPVAASVTAHTVTLVEVEGCEYSMDGETWQDSPVFEELEKNKEYTFYQRVKATATHAASEASTVTLTTAYAHAVVFVDWDGTVLSTQEIKNGEAATAPEDPERFDYFFNGWDKDFSCVTEDMKVTAQYTKDLSEEIFTTVMLLQLSGDNSVTMMPEKDVLGIGDALDLYQMQTMAPAARFVDVAASDWFHDSVISLANKGVVSGYPDGSFRPQGEVTWGEALKLVMKAVGYGDIDATNGHWASGFMAMAIEKGLIPGEVELDAAITRGEMADLTALALKLGEAKNAAPFADEAPASAAALYEAGIINGSADNGQLLYRAESTITRAEISAIIWRVYCAR